MDTTLINRLGKIGFFLILLQSFVTSCYKIDAQSFTPDVPDISFPEQTVTVTSNLDTIDIPVTANLPWRVKSDVDWLSFVEANGEGTGSFRVAIARNRTTESRTAEIIGYITRDAEVKMTIIQQAGEPLPDEVRHFYVKIDGSTGNDGSSWANATTLDMALEDAVNGDFIHIAAGTYIPTVVINGGSASNARDNTFEVTQNVHIIGGYPADATEGSVSNPDNHPVMLSGNNQSYHVVVISAIPEGEHYVSLNGITITGGFAGSSTAGNVNINGINVGRNFGGGMVAVGSKLHLDHCQVRNNSSLNHSPGIHIINSEVKIRNSSISDNTGTSSGNGGGIWNDGSTLYMYNSDITGNSNAGVGGGLYSFAQLSGTGVNCYNYLYNVTIVGNQTSGGARPSGIYFRAGSQSSLVNCTVYGNTGTTGFGAGIAMHGGTTTNIVSTTISNNMSNNTGNGGAGVHDLGAGTNTINVYNSIISGNPNSQYQIGPINQIGGSINIQSSIIGSDVYNYDRAVESGQSFDPATMFSPFNVYGNGHGRTLPVLSGTPATSFGMTLLQLQILGGNLSLDEEEYHLKDQNMRDRAGTTVIGAALPQ